MAMRTDELIAQLSSGLAPVKRGQVPRLLLGAAALGLVGSVVVMLGMMGLRHDIARAMVSFGMWTKLVYTFVIAVFGFWLVERRGRPGAEMTRPLQLLALPLLAIALLAAMQMGGANQADMPKMVLGHSSRVCAFLVTVTALPSETAFWVYERRTCRRSAAVSVASTVMSA